MQNPHTEFVEIMLDTTCEAVLDAMPLPVMLCSRTGIVERVNKAAASLFGLPVSGFNQPCGPALLDRLRLLRPDGEPLAEQEWPWRRAARGQALERVVVQVAGQARVSALFEVVVSPLHPEARGSGWLVVWHALADGASSVRSVSGTLEKTEERYGALVNAAPVAIFVNRGGRIVFVNPATLTLFGADSPSQLLGRSPLELVHPDFREFVAERMAQLARGHRVAPARQQMLRLDGTTRHVRAVATPFVDADGPAIQVILMDITDRIEAEAAIRERNEYIETILENAPIGFAVNSIDDGIARFVSRRFEDIYGVEPGSLGSVDDYFEKVFRDPRQREEMRTRILSDMASGDAARMTWERIPLTTAGGERRFVTAINIPILAKNLMVSTVQDVTARTEAEAKLEDRTRELGQFFELTIDLLCIADLEGRFHRLSREWERTLGYSRTELEGARFLDYVHPEDLEATLGALKLEAAGAEVRGFVNRYRCKDGTYRWLEWHAVAPDGGRIFAVAHDITERRRAEAEIARLNRLYAALSEINQSIVRVQSRDALFARVTRTLVEHGGVITAWVGWLDPVAGRVRVAGRHGLETALLDDLVVSIDPEQPSGQTPAARAIREGRSYVCNDFLNDDATVSLRAFGSRIGCRSSAALPIRVGDRVIGALMVYAHEVGFFGPQEVSLLEETAIDISFALENLEREGKRQEAEEAAREGARRLEAAVGAAHVGLWTWDVRSNEVWFSPEWKRQIGYDDHEVANRFDEWESRVHPDDLDRSLKAVRAFIAGEVPTHRMEFRFRHKDGSYRTILAEASLDRSEQGEPLRMLGSHLDVTDGKRLEEQLRQAQKMEAVGRLAGGVAHDFNNMLGVIMGHAELVATGGLLPEEIRPDIDEILSAARRSADLTRQLLAFARRQTVSPKIIDLNHTVGGMLRMLHRLIGEDITLNWVPGENLWRVMIDPSQVDQVLANLVVNARDAISGSGTVTIETSNVTLDDEYCSSHVGCAPGDYVLLSVSDTGAGMSPAVLERAFEPFFTTKVSGQGTGLGLSTVYGIVKQNGGFINVYSEPGIGTTLKIGIPRSREDGEVFRPSPAGSHHGHETILIVEDAEAILKIGKAMLTRLGYQVLTARSASEAVRVVEECGGRVDLLLTDVVMPEMNGRELAAKLQAIQPSMRCLFMSGYTANVIAHHGVLDRGVHFVQKPFSMDALGAAVREALTGA